VSYSDIAMMADNNDLRMRITAAAAEENKTRPYEQWVAQNIWQLAATPGWDDAWASALASLNPRPGWDAGVISDGMILAAVQPLP
jgi:hypothetical protein